MDHLNRIPGCPNEGRCLQKVMMQMQVRASRCRFVWDTFAPDTRCRLPVPRMPGNRFQHVRLNPRLREIARNPAGCFMLAGRP